MKKIYFIVLWYIISMASINASHIVGGEMSYKYLGNDHYEIRLTAYRDCIIQFPPFDDPAYLGIYDQSLNLFSLRLLPLLQLDTLNLNNQCLPPPVNLCYEITTYIDTVLLPVMFGYYHLVYQRCCRGNSINNVPNSYSTGTTIYTTIPGFLINNSAVFSNNPPIYFCVNSQFQYDLSAFDPDGDSLVYELCTPLDGGMTGTPYPPPYQLIQFQPPYYMNNLLGGPQPLSINPSTGIISGLPNTIGRFVYAVCVKEFRNAVLINTIRREFEINVTAGTVGISENSNVGKINVYPNPTTSNATIEFYSQVEEKVTFSITDIHGRILHNEDLKSTIGKNEILSQHLDKGYYIIKLVSENGELIDKLIVY